MTDPRVTAEVAMEICEKVRAGDVCGSSAIVALVAIGVDHEVAFNAIESIAKAEDSGKADPGDVFITTWCSDPRGKAESRFNALADDYEDLLNMTLIAIRQRCVEFVEYERAKAGASTKVLSE